LFKIKIDLARYVTPALAVLLGGCLILFLFFPGYSERALGVTRGASGMASFFAATALSLYLNRKKIHTLILRSFIGPFVVAFSVILFVLVLQFLAKYMEDIMGKNLGGDVLLKVFGLACLTLVTMALPLGILLSSLLTMGNMGERYELAALKSGGIGLFKAIRPLAHATLVVTTASLFFAFYATPMANLKLYTLLYDLSRVKPTFAIKANHFYSGIDGMVVHVGGVDDKTDEVFKIRIYDHSKSVGNNSITVAERGKMLPSKAAGYLDMTLYHGVVFDFKGPEEVGNKVHQCQRFYFDTLHYMVPLEGFNLEESQEDPFHTHQYMLNFFELDDAIDSMEAKRDGYFEDYRDFNRKYVHLDTILNKGQREAMAMDSVVYPPSDPIAADTAKPTYEWFPSMDRKDLLAKTINQVQALANYTKVMEDRLKREAEKQRKFEIEQHTRLMLPASCIVFLLLGASLGSIIRKGGIGIPVLFSIGFFILFYILMIQGKKFARDEIMPLWAGVWLPVLVMFPMALFFTYKSATESPIFYSANWYKVFRFLFGWLPWMKRKAPVQQTMSVEELVRLRQKYKDDARMSMEKHQQQENANGDS
jgi:lipopolysaccharide export system permease protein